MKFVESLDPATRHSKPAAPGATLVQRKGKRTGLRRFTVASAVASWTAPSVVCLWNQLARETIPPHDITIGIQHLEARIEFVERSAEQLVLQLRPIPGFLERPFPVAQLGGGVAHEIGHGEERRNHGHRLGQGSEWSRRLPLPELQHRHLVHNCEPTHTRNGQNRSLHGCTRSTQDARECDVKGIVANEGVLHPAGGPKHDRQYEEIRQGLGHRGALPNLRGSPSRGIAEQLVVDGPSDQRDRKHPHTDAAKGTRDREDIRDQNAPQGNPPKPNQPTKALGREPGTQ